MNKELTEQIVKHVFANFGILHSSYVNYDLTKSLIDKEFLLNQKLVFHTEDGQIIKNPIYGCQFTIENKEFKILLGDCSQDDQTLEFILIAHLTDNPVYSLYCVCDPSVDSEAMIAVSVNHKDWMPCSTFLQATFLVAMEHLKDTNLGWSKCTNYQRHYEMMLSAINFHDVYCEVEV